MLAIAVAGAQGDSSRVSFASPLAGQTLSGKQKWEVTVANGSPVEQVQFFVDDQSKPLWTEREAPYVFGGDLGVLDTSSLSNGTHVLAVTLYDKSAKPETFKQEFTVANGVTPTPTPPPSAPKVEFASPTGGQALAGQVKWEATASGTVSRVEFFLDNASAPVWTEREAPYVFNGDAGLLDTTKLADGAHVLGLKAVASDGTTGEAKVTVNIANAVPTTTPPTAPVLKSTPAKETTETSASFAFSTSTAGAQLECALDRAALAACASPKSYSGLTIGLHTFSVRAVAGGVASAVATYSWTISDPSPQPSTCASGEWKAEFFANSTLGGSPVLTRCDAAVSFDWGYGQPAASVPADKFSARWVSTWTFPAGSTTFTVTADDGFRLAIDGQVVLEKWVDQPPTTYTVTRTLTSGMHDVRLEYFENTGGAVAKLSWSGTTQATTSASGAVLFRDNYDSGRIDTSQWAAQCQPWLSDSTRGTVNVVTGPVDGGSGAARIDLPATGTTSACELLRGRKVNLGGDDYYSLAYYFPSGWREPSSAFWGAAVAQFNYQLIWGAPAGLAAHSDRLVLTAQSGYCNDVYSSSPGCTYSNGAGGEAAGNMTCTPSCQVIPKGQLTLGVWHEIVVHIRWAADSTGLIEAWHRTKGSSSWTKTVTISGYPTIQWSNARPLTGWQQDQWTTNDKLGAYRAESSSPLTMYNDGFCVGTSFSAVSSCLG